MIYSKKIQINYIVGNFIIIRKLIAITLILTFLLLLNANIVFAASGTLAFVDGNNIAHLLRLDQQEQSNWCWAAASKTAGDFYGAVKLGTMTGNYHTQSDIVTTVKGSAINAGGTPAEISQAYTYAGRQAPYSQRYSTSYALANTFSYSSFKGYINEHKPTITSLILVDTGVVYLHAFVVTEYDDKNTSTSSNNRIRLADPATGDYWGWVKYSDFISGFSYYGYMAYFGSFGGSHSYGIYIA